MIKISTIPKSNLFVCAWGGGSEYNSPNEFHENKCFSVFCAVGKTP